MFEGDFADTCDKQFPLVSMGGWVEGPAFANPGTRTRIGASGNYYKFSRWYANVDCYLKWRWKDKASWYETWKTSQLNIYMLCFLLTKSTYLRKKWTWTTSIIFSDSQGFLFSDWILMFLLLLHQTQQLQLVSALRTTFRLDFHWVNNWSEWSALTPLVVAGRK